jgi:transcription factor TGA
VCGSTSTGVAGFEINYSHWVDEQKSHGVELMSALQGQQTSELELRLVVETGFSNYEHLFRIKAMATSSDVFYVMSGMWKTPAERLFLSIGGFRPSEVLKVGGSLTVLSPTHTCDSSYMMVDVVVADARS